MTQVHPVTAKNDKQEKLREEASLGEGEEVFADTDAGTQRSEFEHLLDFLDTDSNGKVSALELADFVDSLLGTQDHRRPEGSIVFEAVLSAAMRQASIAASASAATDKADGGRTGSGRPGSNHRRPPPPPPPPPPPASLLAASAFAKDAAAAASTGSPRGSTDAARGQDSSTRGLLAAARGSVTGKGSISGAAGGGGGKSSSSRLGLGPAACGGGGLTEAQVFGSQVFLDMDSVRECFAALLQDTSLWVRMAARYSVMTGALFRQLLMYSAGTLDRRFSLVHFAWTWGAFNALPLWLPFRRLWHRGGDSILLQVYCHQLTKLHQQLGPGVSSRVNMHVLLVALTLIQFIATYVPLISFLAAYGIPNMWQQHTVVGWMHAQPMHTKLSFFVSILPFAVLQFLTSSGALKLSCRDFLNLKEQCKAVFLMGDVSAQFEGYGGLMMRTVMDTIKGRVEDMMSASRFRKLNATMPLLFGIGLEVFRRLVRLFLVHNWVPQSTLGRVAAPFEVYALFYNIWFAYSESADCTQYLLELKKIGSTFKTLLNKEEALSQQLPWLNNHSPRNLLLWSRLRRYYQSPNCLELRWIEMHLTLVIVAAVAVTVILIVTFVQGTLTTFTPENADLQVFVVWVIPAFIYLVAGVVLDVIMSASTGQMYHDDVQVLTSEAVSIEERLNSAAELDRLPPAPTATGVASATAAQPFQRSSSQTQLMLSPPGRSGSGSGLAGDANGTGGLGGRDAGDYGGSGGGRLARRSRSGASGLGTGGGEAMLGLRELGELGVPSSSLSGGWVQWRPAEHFRLSEDQKSLVTYIQFNVEYITIFGIPIDTNLRNTLFSLAVTLMGAAVSAFLAIILQKK